MHPSRGPTTTVLDVGANPAPSIDQSVSLGNVATEVRRRRKTMAPDRKREKKKADPKKGSAKTPPRKDKSAKGPPRTNRRSQG